MHEPIHDKDERRSVTTFFEPLRRLLHEVERGWETPFFTPHHAHTTMLGFGACELVAEPDGKAYRLTVELPGMAASEVSAEARDGSFIISGEKRREQDVDKPGLMLAEREYGRFERRVRLPADAKLDQAEARYADGVLRLRVPRATEPNAGKSIPIQSG